MRKLANIGAFEGLQERQHANFGMPSGNAVFQDWKTCNNASFPGSLRNPNDEELAKREMHRINQAEDDLRILAGEIWQMNEEIKALQFDRDTLNEEYDDMFKSRNMRYISASEQLETMGFRPQSDIFGKQ